MSNNNELRVTNKEQGRYLIRDDNEFILVYGTGSSVRGLLVSHDKKYLHGLDCFNSEEKGVIST